MKLKGRRRSRGLWGAPATSTTPFVFRREWTQDVREVALGRCGYWISADHARSVVSALVRHKRRSKAWRITTADICRLVEMYLE